VVERTSHADFGLWSLGVFWSLELGAWLIRHSNRKHRGSPECYLEDEPAAPRLRPLRDAARLNQRLTLRQNLLSMVQPATKRNNMKRSNHPALWSIPLLLMPFLAASQSYDISWFTIDGGGGTSTGGVYSVSGTIGQPDAGKLSGGSFTLDGGFWGVVLAIQTPGAPYLSVTRSNTSVVVSWPLPALDFVLDQTATLTGSPPPWVQVPFPYVTNATDIFITVPSPAANRFYRLRHP
jgi:hypothetical protein